MCKRINQFLVSIIYGPGKSQTSTEIPVIGSCTSKSWQKLAYDGQTNTLIEICW